MAKLSNNSMALVTEIERTKAILARINWSFSTPFSVGRSGESLFDCRKYHWFPATFIPEIPYTLIDVLTHPGAVVFDPFAGIGTTIFQALFLDRKPYGTEINLVATEIMRSIWVLLNPETDISGATNELSDIKRSYDHNTDYSQELKNSTINVDQLSTWFSPSTFNQVLFLMLREITCHQPGLKAAMRISLSATLKAASAQDRGWGCIADNVLPKPTQLKKEKNALAYFPRSFSTLIRDISRAREALSHDTQEFLSSSNPDEYIFQADVRQSIKIPDQSVDLIITSPPYPNMTDYSMSQRLSYYWLGTDPNEDLALEIGARRKRFKATAIEDYQSDMEVAINTISKKVKKGGYLCFVMPVFTNDKRNNLERKRVVQECLAFFLNNDLVREVELDRTLPTRRRHHNQKWTSLEKECIYLYRKVS